MAGKFPQILNDDIVGEQAQSVYDDAQVLLKEVIAKKAFHAHAVCSLFRAHQSIKHPDDIEIYIPQENGEDQHYTLHTLRQQMKRPPGRPNYALSDFVPPQEGPEGHMGAFMVCVEAEEIIRQAEEDQDDYRAILLKALADRCAEAFAEYLHQEVRRSLWGYVPDEKWTCQELIDEKYQGIRPAPGYPACPDHTEKGTLFKILDIASSSAPAQLTEHYAIYPASAVCGYYFAHLQTQYFGLGRIGQDQVQSYAQRKGWTLQETEKWLMPSLGYTPQNSKGN